uniref:Retrotransposon gag domain-containing protein n=1 Tax=Oryzias latipes TaxID=8090 RepID=A0A3P9IMQ9_ORYLA
MSYTAPHSQRLFYTLPDQGTTMEDAMSALKAHFNPKRNAVAERHVFRKRAQSQTESILQYVAALRDLAATCGFDDKQDEMIRDQLVEHVRSQRIRERLLLEADLTLNKAVTLATQIEAATDFLPYQPSYPAGHLYLQSRPQTQFVSFLSCCTFISSKKDQNSSGTTPNAL